MNKKIEILKKAYKKEKERVEEESKRMMNKIEE